MEVKRSGVDLGNMSYICNSFLSIAILFNSSIDQPKIAMTIRTTNTHFQGQLMLFHLWCSTFKDVVVFLRQFNIDKTFCVGL